MLIGSMCFGFGVAEGFVLLEVFEFVDSVESGC